MRSMMTGSLLGLGLLLGQANAEAGEVVTPMTTAEAGGHGGASAEPHHPGHREHRHYAAEEDAGEWVPHVLVSFKGGYVGSWADGRDRRDIGATLFGLGVELAHGKLEFESALIMGFSEGDAGFYWEPALRMPFHVSHVFEPFLTVAPVLSFGFERETEEAAEGHEGETVVRISPEIGFVASPGAYFWITEHVGLTANVGYRFLIAHTGLKHQLVAAGGLTIRY